jgi:hypothetical protein
MHSGDYNRDGFPDLILAGNFYGSRLKFGRLDASRGVLLLGKGDGSFTAVPNRESGLALHGEIRDMAELTLGDNSEILIFAPNNDSLQLYRTNQGMEK